MTNPGCSPAPRLLLLTTGMEVGGAERQILLSGEALIQRGWDARIVSLIPLGPLGREAQDLGIPICSLGMRRGVPDPRGAIRLLRMVRRWRPHVLHTHMVHANLLGRLVRPLLGVPAVVSTIHSIQDGGRLRLWAYRVTDSLTDLTTIVSEAARDRYVRLHAVPRARLRVVPNAVDIELFRPRPEERPQVRQALGVSGFIWLAVGRFEAAKDYPTMLTAFARVAATRLDATLLLVGDGSLRTRSESEARSLGLADRVRFLGIRSDVPRLMAGADGFVLSSAWEGMPTVLLEAAAAGLPAIATMVGGNAEVLLEGKTGFLVPAGNTRALGQAMLRLMECPPEQREALGACARALVCEKYSRERIVDRWEDVYCELLDARRHHGVRGRAQEVGEGVGGQR